MSKKDGSLGINGATFEIFEDSLKDIEVWVKKVKKLGYNKIILMGHSLGCNKALYYLSKNKGDVQGLILALHLIWNVKNNNPRKLLNT